jgi:hypothetical protein
MIFWTRERNMYPEQGPKERAAEILRILAISGPRYMEIEVIAGDYQNADPRSMSWASWYTLQQAEPEQVVTLKIRIDQASKNRA